jgi:hypothetical protein
MHVLRLKQYPPATRKASNEMMTYGQKPGMKAAKKAGKKTGKATKMKAKKKK